MNIFGKNKKTDGEKQADAFLKDEYYDLDSKQGVGTCGCGRSPTGKCVGWHGLSEEEYQERKELYATGKVELSGKEIKQ